MDNSPNIVLALLRRDKVVIWLHVIGLSNIGRGMHCKVAVRR